MQTRVHAESRTKPLVFDRQLADIDRPYNAELETVLVPDPKPNVQGDQLKVSKRLDNFSRMMARGQLKTRADDHPKGDGSEALFAAGQKYQRLNEAGALGAVGSVDPTREAVDGGLPRDPLTDRQQKALREIARVEASLKREWGILGVSLIRAVLCDGRSLTKVAEIMGHDATPGSADMRSLSWLFVKCLEQVATDLGYMDG